MRDSYIQPLAVARQNVQQPFSHLTSHLTWQPLQRVREDRNATGRLHKSLPGHKVLSTLMSYPRKIPQSLVKLTALVEGSSSLFICQESSEVLLTAVVPLPGNTHGRRLSWPLVVSIAGARSRISSQSCLPCALIMLVGCFYIG